MPWHQMFTASGWLYDYRFGCVRIKILRVDDISPFLFILGLLLNPFSEKHLFYFLFFFLIWHKHPLKDELIVLVKGQGNCDFMTSHLREHEHLMNVSQTCRAVYFRFVTNVHLCLRMKWTDFGGQGSKSRSLTWMLHIGAFREFSISLLRITTV